MGSFLSKRIKSQPMSAFEKNAQKGIGGSFQLFIDAHEVEFCRQLLNEAIRYRLDVHIMSKKLRRVPYDYLVDDIRKCLESVKVSIVVTEPEIEIGDSAFWSVVAQSPSGKVCQLDSSYLGNSHEFILVGDLMYWTTTVPESIMSFGNFKDRETGQQFEMIWHGAADSCIEK